LDLPGLPLCFEAWFQQRIGEGMDRRTASCLNVIERVPLVSNVNHNEFVSPVCGGDHVLNLLIRYGGISVLVADHVLISRGTYMAREANFDV
jgi:hypothetical protein